MIFVFIGIVVAVLLMVSWMAVVAPFLMSHLRVVLSVLTIVGIVGLGCAIGLMIQLIVSR